MARTSRNHAGVIRSNLKRTRPARRARARGYAKNYSPKPAYWSTGKFSKKASVWKNKSRRVVSPGYSRPRGLKKSRTYQKPKRLNPATMIRSKVMRRQLGTRRYPILL